ncbi:lipoprotein [Dyadobacter endophyticus]|uniref:Lipoprotein n=1 Tax=Dyadobacter endophyticus TaxID=1749036 RepID=A0ABQ1YL12_9BACT|nr:TraB/GumN family protein [Dyadobacter endophyticus]GGH28830.1 lipoprotein [Dyadobacter endophyticus]
MKKALLFASLLILHSAAIFGQENQSVLWKISGNGLKKPSYLFGTVHTASVKILDRFPKIMQIAAGVDFALFEKGGNTIGNVEDAEIYTPPLDSVFTPEEYALVDSFFTASPFGSIKPHNNEASLMAMCQAVVMLKQKDSKNQDGFFDDIIQTRLQDSGKPTFQLDETGQMARREENRDNRILAKAIVVMIKNDFREKDITPEDFFDPDLYAATLEHPMKLDQKAPQFILDDTVERHGIWLPKIEVKVKEGSCFIAVGMAHLQYQTGLIQLLKNNGYTLNPVNL